MNEKSSRSKVGFSSIILASYSLWNATAGQWQPSLVHLHWGSHDYSRSENCIDG